MAPQSCMLYDTSDINRTSESPGEEKIAEHVTIKGTSAVVGVYLFVRESLDLHHVDSTEVDRAFIANASLQIEL
jgi:hypothetical protein